MSDELERLEAAPLDAGFAERVRARARGELPGTRGAWVIPALLLSGAAMQVAFCAHLAAVVFARPGPGVMRMYQRK
jgi:hypothetical protein